jgi:SAM-dependent methyltransferase
VGVDPGAELLGDIVGKHILDIGSGAGHHAVHFARSYKAHVTGIELSPTQHQRAIDNYGDVAGVRFVHGDVVQHLKNTEPYDAAYAIGSLAYTDPRTRPYPPYAMVYAPAPLWSSPSSTPTCTATDREPFQRCRSRVRMAAAIDDMRFGLHRALRKIRQDFSRATPRSTEARAADSARLTVCCVGVRSRPGGRLRGVVTHGPAPA